MPGTLNSRDISSGMSTRTAEERHPPSESNKNSTHVNLEAVRGILLALQIHLQSPMDEERRNRCRTLLSEALTLVNDRPASFSGSNIGSRLTRREREIAFAVSKGKSNVAIADDLFISVNTVRFHVRNTLRKLEASNRNEIAAMILGWVAAPASLPTRAISPSTPPIS